MRNLKRPGWKEHASFQKFSMICLKFGYRIQQSKKRKGHHLWSCKKLGKIKGKWSKNFLGSRWRDILGKWRWQDEFANIRSNLLLDPPLNQVKKPSAKGYSMSLYDCRNLLKEFELAGWQIPLFLFFLKWCLIKISYYYPGNFKSVFKKNEIIPKLLSVLIVIRSINANNKAMKITMNVFTI